MNPSPIKGYEYFTRELEIGERVHFFDPSQKGESKVIHSGTVSESYIDDPVHLYKVNWEDGWTGYYSYSSRVLLERV